ncbi:MAG: hypothetical protein AAF532_01315 [Planctomycetota bacterium]
MRPVLGTVLACLAALATPAPHACAEDAPAIDRLKCFMMSRRDVTDRYTVDYKEGELFFCCRACISRMKRSPTRYEAQANHQLVRTGQYEQNDCPLTGEDLTSDSPGLEIGGVTVRFSAESHKAEVEALSEKEQIARVFGTEGFEKGGFTKVEKEDAAG